MIDSQGRLFGRWNPVDGAILGLVGLILVGGLSAGTQWILRGTAPLPIKTVEMDLDLVVQPPAGPPPIGETVLDMNAKPIGQVLDTWSFPRMYPSPHPEAVSSRAGVTLQMTLPFKGEGFQLNGKLSGLGSTVSFKTSQGTYAGVIKIVSPKILFWVQASVRCSGIPSEIASIVQVGDFQRSPSGRVISKISKIYSNDIHQTPQSVLPGPEGTFKRIRATISSTAVTHEILLSLQFLVQSEGDKYLFQNKPLLVGQEVALDTAIYSIRGQILNVVTTLEGQPLFPRFIPEEYYTEKKVKVKIRFQATGENLLKLIEVGDEEHGYDDEVLARVEQLEVRQPETMRIFTLFGAGTAGGPKWNILSESAQPNYSAFAQMMLTCYLRRDGAIFYQGKQIRIGSPIEFRSVLYQLEGVLVDFLTGTPAEESPPQKIQMEADFLSDPLLPAVAHLIQIGDRDRLLRGEATVELIQVTLGKRFYRTSPWDINPQRVRLRLRLRCVQDGSRILFDGKPIKIGRILTLNFPEYDLSGTILSLQPSQG